MALSGYGAVSRYPDQLRDLHSEPSRGRVGAVAILHACGVGRSQQQADGPDSARMKKLHARREVPAESRGVICAVDVVGVVGAAHVVDGLSIPNDRVRFLKTDVDDAPCKHNPWQLLATSAPGMAGEESTTKPLSAHRVRVYRRIDSQRRRTQVLTAATSSAPPSFASLDATSDRPDEYGARRKLTGRPPIRPASKPVVMALTESA